jgi:HK97 family phage major capsid protein
MKKQSLIFQEKRGEVQDKIDAILESVEKTETRTASEAQMNDLKELRSQRDTLDQQIKDAQVVEAEQLAREQRTAATNGFNVGAPRNQAGEAGETRNIAAQFSFRKVIDDQIKGRRTDGLEAEMIQQGEKEARTAGHSAEGIALPGMLVGKAKGAAEQRTALGITTAATAGDLVQAGVGEVVDYLYPRTVLRDLGASFKGPLRDGFDLINQDAGSSATWEGEVDANAETNPTVAKTAVRPKRLGAYTIFSKQLLNQAVLDVENWVRTDLGIAIGQALEVAAINGSGSAPIPRGILNISGIGDVAGGTNGLIPTWGNMVELETDVNAANAPMGRRAYLTTPGVNGVLKTIKKDAGSGIFINENGMVNGYPMLFSSNVPSTLTKGSASGICHAIIFGNWEELYVMQWGGIDLVVNPYSLDTTSQVRVTINSWWDIAVRHKESFSAMKDALIS